jgi:hypothetical protein
LQEWPQFDLKRHVLPRWQRLFDDLINGRKPAGATAAGATPTVAPT